ncbi:MAG: hypothetical protein JWO72_1920 [Caulobacteraceae bacterium]|nr:hypothetical protein [Caulobacteraceae bacterium]
MRVLIRLTVLLAACLGLAAPALAKPDLLVLFSIDGFRADYLGRGVTRGWPASTTSMCSR